MSDRNVDEMVRDSEFDRERDQSISQLGAAVEAKEAADRFLVEATRYRYSYHFDWMGLPIIQFPADIVAIQELIWLVRPQIIIETGVARGGSLMLSASMLELTGGNGLVVGIDLDIRPINRRAISEHPLAHRIELVEGSSTDVAVLDRVRELVNDMGPVMVLLDSMHTEEHVLAELDLYSPLVSVGSYVIVFDTLIEQMPADMYPDRPWAADNNPGTAVREFLKGSEEFELDSRMRDKLLISTSANGYLRRVR